MVRDSTIDRGTDEKIRVEIDGDPPEEWDGLNAAEVWWVLLDDEGGEVVLEKFSGDADLTITADGGGDTPGEFVVELTADETEGLDEDTYYQEVVLRDADGDVSSARLSPYNIQTRDTAASEVGA